MVSSSLAAGYHRKRIDFGVRKISFLLWALPLTNHVLEWFIKSFLTYKTRIILSISGGGYKSSFKRGLEIEVLLIRDERIYPEVAFGKLAHWSHLNLFEVMEIIGKSKITPILKSLIGTTMECRISRKNFWVT